MPKLVYEIEPAPKLRAKTTKYGTYTPQKTVLYEARIRAAWKAAGLGMMPDNTPLSFTVKLFMPMPQSMPKSMRIENSPHWKKPDADNLAKAIGDALNGIAYRDDSRICEMYAIKLYSERPRIEVDIHEYKAL